MIVRGFAALIFGLIVSIGAQAQFVVVAHADTAAAEDPEQSLQQVRRLFLKEQSNWTDGTTATAFQREQDNPAMQAFHKSVLEKSDAEVLAHWQKLKQLRGETPPRAVGSARILLRLVAREPGRFGIVTREEAANLPPDVKILFEYMG